MTKHQKQTKQREGKRIHPALRCVALYCMGWVVLVWNGNCFALLLLCSGWYVVWCLYCVYVMVTYSSYMPNANAYANSLPSLSLFLLLWLPLPPSSERRLSLSHSLQSFLNDSKNPLFNSHGFFIVLYLMPAFRSLGMYVFIGIVYGFITIYHSLDGSYLIDLLSFEMRFFVC